MVYESSYESGRKPYVPDLTRGYWAAPNDFLYACWGLAFKMDIFNMAWYFFFEMGIISIIPYLIGMALYVVPILLIQSFLGQFSSSGFVSALRISPLFKGMGYISLAVNFSILTYYSVYAAIPLFYFFHSMRPTLPWSCEAFKEWSNEVPTNGEINLCTNTTMQYTHATTTVSSTTDSSEESYGSEYIAYEVPSVAFFRSIFHDYNFVVYEDVVFSLPWQLVLCMLLVWSSVALIFYKITNTETMGKLIRYTVWLLVALMLICLTRFLFLTDARAALHDYFLPHNINLRSTLISIPIFTLASFGAGWGNIISLASYNKFKTNLMRFSWFISLGQLLFLVLFSFTSFLLDRHFDHITQTNFLHYTHEHWVLYLSSGSALSEIGLANMWSMLFFSLLCLSGTLILVIQLFSILTAIFDEFEFLRSRREVVTFGLIGLLAFCSLYFCSNHGLFYLAALPNDAIFTQTILNLLLMLIVLWIYGRVRFQRDIEFMLGQRFATWRIYVLRFIAPLCMLITMFMAFLTAYMEHYYGSFVIFIAAIFFIGIPWIFVPGFAIFSLFQTSGTLGMRFKRCCRPTDWYPVDPEERQRYEDAMGNLDITHQLNEVGDEEVP